MSVSQIQGLETNPAHVADGNAQPQAVPIPYSALFAYKEAMVLFSDVADALGEIIAKFEIVSADPGLSADFSRAGLHLREILQLTAEDLGRAKEEAKRLGEDTFRSSEAVKPLLETNSSSRFVS